MAVCHLLALCSVTVSQRVLKLTFPSLLTSFLLLPRKCPSDRFPGFIIACRNGPRLLMEIEPLPSCCPDLRTPAASHDEKLHYQLLSVFQFRKDVPNCFNFLITQSAIFYGCCETYVRAPKALNWVHINYPRLEQNGTYAASAQASDQ